MELNAKEAKFLINILGVFKEAADRSYKRMAFMEQFIVMTDKLKELEGDALPEDIAEKIEELKGNSGRTREKFMDDVKISEGLLFKLGVELQIVEPQS